MPRKPENMSDMEYIDWSRAQSAAYVNTLKPPGTQNIQRQGKVGQGNERNKGQNEEKKHKHKHK